MNCEPGCTALNTCCGWPSTPARALLPVLHLGPRTQNAAQSVIHSLRQILAAFLRPAFQKFRLQPVLLWADCPFWTVAPGDSPRAQRTPVAGGGGADLRPGEKMLTFGASWCA